MLMTAGGHHEKQRGRFGAHRKPWFRCGSGRLRSAQRQTCRLAAVEIDMERSSLTAWREDRGDRGPLERDCADYVSAQVPGELQGHAPPAPRHRAHHSNIWDVEYG